MTPEPLTLDVRDLKTYFRVGEHRIARAVDGISFQLQAGRTLALVGESGCGKSQTAFSIMRLIERNGFHGDQSRVWFEGEDLLSQSEEAMRRIRGNRIAMIFQEPMSSLNPLYRIGNQLAEPLRLHRGLDRAAARAEAIRLLDQVGIPTPAGRIDNYPHELSGGMKQRVMIAMALACRPRLLIADEPTTALDVTIQAQILALMADLQRTNGMPILLITHDMGVVYQMADDVGVMYAGRLVETGTKDAVFGQPQHPYTRRLLESIPASGGRRFRLRTIPGRVPSAEDLHPGCRFYERCAERVERCAREEPPFHPGGRGDSHRVACHLLQPGYSGDRMAAVQPEPRPNRAPVTSRLVDVTDLHTHFPVKHGILRRTIDHVRAVDGIDLVIRRGETVALVGESGCGKTTVAQSLLALIGEARGRVLLEGDDVLLLGGVGLKRLRRRTQIVFQDPFSSLNPRMRIGAIVEEGLRIHLRSVRATERARRVRTVLERVGLTLDVADRYPHEFSGGQRQRIALARALVLEPDLLILDEPTSALDVSVQAQILNLLEGIQAERGLAYLFITHDLGVVEYISDTVAVMYLGRIVETARTELLFRQPRHPYTRALLAAVPRVGRVADHQPIAGDVPSPVRPPPGCRFHPRCPFAQPACARTPPTLDSVEPDHRVACWRWREISADVHHGPFDPIR